MEFAAAALTSIGSTIASGASTVASGVASLSGASFGLTGATFGGATSGGLLSTLGTASTAASILSGGATVLSVLNTYRAGQQKADAYNAQASDAELSSTVAGLQGTERQNSLRAQLADALGQRDVATAAGGVDVSFGSAAAARAKATEDTQRALSLDQSTTQLQQARLRERAANYRKMALDASAGGLASAAAGALEGGAKMMRRGIA